MALPRLRKKILKEQTPNCDPGVIVNDAMKTCTAAKVLSYLANAHKHGGVDAKQRWAIDIAPQIADPYVLGQQLSFPHRLKPTVLIWGGKLAEIEFVGSAEADDEKHQFNDFVWKHSCYIKNHDGKTIGDVVSFCEMTFALWMKVLRDAGFVLFPYFALVRKNREPYMIKNDGIGHLCLFSGADEMQAFYDTLPPEEQKAMGDEFFVVFKTPAVMAKVLTDSATNLVACGCSHLAFDPTLRTTFKRSTVTGFVAFLNTCSGDPVA